MGIAMGHRTSPKLLLASLGFLFVDGPLDHSLWRAVHQSQDLCEATGQTNRRLSVAWTTSITNGDAGSRRLDHQSLGILAGLFLARSPICHSRVTLNLGTKIYRLSSSAAAGLSRFRPPINLVSFSGNHRDRVELLATSGCGLGHNNSISWLCGCVMAS